ncbi:MULTISPECIES: peptidoglycan-binding domain-containing protein [unclassified Streptomyces]|uniref:peptidoglycan-binding domain-containing protein n=1 Tax=unclassified Streptomyces TaxID=2593676 RepID=UPI001F0C2A38|nr:MULTISPECIES: peptidoglycan-binding domain-containing protein [unclassified Streptomyces]
MQSLGRLRACVATGVLTTALLGAAAVVAPAASAAPAASGLVSRCTKAGNIIYPTYYIRMPVNSSGAGELDCVLPVGSTGSAVVALQRTLNRCYAAGLAEDGVYGDLTKGAVRKAQRAAGVTADGVYGPVTAASIRHATWSREIPDRFLGCRRYTPS